MESCQRVAGLRTRYHRLMAKRTTSGSSLAVPPAGHDAGSDSKAAQTKARILDAAARVLSVKGYAGLRLTDVAEVAELQAPATITTTPRATTSSKRSCGPESPIQGNTSPKFSVRFPLRVRRWIVCSRLSKPICGTPSKYPITQLLYPQCRSGPAEDPQAPDSGGGALRRDLAPTGQRHGPLRGTAG